MKCECGTISNRIEMDWELKGIYINLYTYHACTFRGGASPVAMCYKSFVRFLSFLFSVAVLAQKEFFRCISSCLCRKHSLNLQIAEVEEKSIKFYERVKASAILPRNRIFIRVHWKRSSIFIQKRGVQQFFHYYCSHCHSIK